MHYSYKKTKNIDINIQITEQLVKNLSKLKFSRSSDLPIDKCNDGILPFSYIPLEEKEAKKRVLEEEAYQNTTTKTVSHCKNKNKNAPIMCLEMKYSG